MNRRAVVTLAISLGFLVTVALPAEASTSLVQKKSISGPNGRSGSVQRYADRDPGHIYNSVTISANDADGSGGKCTETWVDYSTKPHLHFNPGLFVNCRGGNQSVSGALTNTSPNVSGVAIVVCEVPNTTGAITRNSTNCRGSLSAIYLHSGQKYDKFRVSASQYPSGVKIYKA